MKNLEKNEAVRLRQQGCSIKSIAKQLMVSASSVSRWVENVVLTEFQIANLENNTRNGIIKSGQKSAETARTRRLQYQESGRNLVRNGNLDFIAICMLYWGEGTKDKNTLAMVNSDAEMLLFFKDKIKKLYEIENENFSINLNFFDDIKPKDEIERYWLSKLDLPDSCLNKSRINDFSRSSKKKRLKKLEYGTCRLLLCRTDIVQAVYGGIQELAGVFKPAWLG